jgi:type II secretory pathway component PulM
VYDTIWDRLAAWLAQYTAGEQLGIMAAAGVVVLTVIMWVTM